MSFFDDSDLSPFHRHVLENGLDPVKERLRVTGARGRPYQFVQESRCLSPEERVKILRRDLGAVDEDTCPRWVGCGCGHGAIQVKWGDNIYCEKCGGLM